MARDATKEAIMHPDQMYQLRQLQHQDLRAEGEQARARRAGVSERMAERRAWLMTWMLWARLMCS
jgi:hypothetical protein